MKLFVLSSFYLFFTIHSNSQTFQFEGKLYDKWEKRPLRDIRLFFKGKELSKTDVNGKFSFSHYESKIIVNFYYDSLLNNQANSLISNDYTLISGIENVIFLDVQNKFLLSGPLDSPPTITNLPNVTITGYNNNRPLSEIPASIAKINQTDLSRFSNNSILPALNTIPGVKMEERSPGSFRLAIRGSSLRSPFGVRNVKIYWNDIPLTDAGGNTYLNLFDFNSIENIEVIKGPAGSMYGAGTGGVVLLQGPLGQAGQKNISIKNTVGSYGLFGSSAHLSISSNKIINDLTYSHQKAAGYRRNSNMERNILQMQNKLLINEKNSLIFNTFYSDIFYQTPGGLTQAQFDKDPQQARPASGTNKSAEDLKAAIYQKIFFIGLSNFFEFNQSWSNKTSIYYNNTHVENPTFLNYEKRNENGFGGRTVTTYSKSSNKIKYKLSFGGEFQKGIRDLQDYGNKAGQPDTLQTANKIKVNLLNAFAQTEIDLPANFYLTIGASFNQLDYSYSSYRPALPEGMDKKFNPVFLPRVAILKKLKSLSVFTSLSEGFSPPTIEEISPSGNLFNQQLNPEKGINYELGLRGKLLSEKIIYDATVYNFELTQSIIKQSNKNGDYFNNAGLTSQKGLEVKISYSPINNPSGFIRQLKIAVSETYNQYIFKEYTSVIKNNTKFDTLKFSGNWITGVPTNIFVSTLDLLTGPGIYFNLTLNCTNKTPLNDANIFFAKAYQLFDGKAGYKKSFKKLSIDIFGGINNIFNQHYSLGNDINAFGNRFFNPAALQNYYGGINLAYKLTKK